MSANDDEEFVRREIDWIGVPLACEKPFLGICLGAQMLARHLGHRVAPHPEGRVEVGYYPIRATESGQKVWPGLFPKKVYQWHREGFDLPRGATLLAEGDDFQAQAFRYGRSAYGLQFHPEGDLPDDVPLDDGRHGADGDARRHARADRHFKDWFLHDSTVARWLDGFLRSWIVGSGRTMPPMRVGPDPQMA